VLDDGTPVWQITADPTEAASAAVGETIIGTLPKALGALLSELPEAWECEPRAARPTPAVPTAANPIPPAYALSRLSALMPQDAIVVEEAPSHRPAIQQFLPMRGADSFYTMASGGLGYSLPASVGVSLARPGRRIVCLIGDGSAMYCIQAIWTAAQRELPITFVVMNNSGYGAMRAFSQLMQSHRPPGIDLPGLDFVALAKGHGCPGQCVTDAAHLDRILGEALVANGPALVEIVVDAATADLFSPPRSGSA
jgi:benzoylformate decarboxylase